jgi:hypothetical protein
MLIYGYIFPPRSNCGQCREWWHPADQEELYAAWLRPSESIQTLAFWLGADADSISDASLQDVPPTLAANHFMWGGIDMELEA